LLALTVGGDSAKAGQTRHIPLNAEALQIGFKSAWGKLHVAAKIAVRFRWHDLRNHFASRLAQAGVPLNTIRELLKSAGHASAQQR
jgi:site-specific recombinase XerD